VKICAYMIWHNRTTSPSSGPTGRARGLAWADFCVLVLVLVLVLAPRSSIFRNRRRPVAMKELR
jgi:hypothetical protein